MLSLTKVYHKLVTKLQQTNYGQFEEEMWWEVPTSKHNSSKLERKCFFLVVTLSDQGGKGFID